METKRQKQTRRTFKTQQEREELTRIRKRGNKRDQRKRNKEKLEKLNRPILIPNIKLFRQKYRKNFYIGLRHKSFNKFLSLSCKDTVSLNWLITKGKMFIIQLKAAGILGNYLLVYEHEGDNYHIHILADISDGDKLKELMDLWKYGNTKVVDVNDQDSKDARIYYCTKQLNPDSSNPNDQRLIDSWELDLIPATNKLTEQNSSLSIKVLAETHVKLNLSMNSEDNFGITDLPITPIKCNSHISPYKKLVYRFLFWLILMAMLFNGSQAN